MVIMAEPFKKRKLASSLSLIDTDSTQTLLASLSAFLPSGLPLCLLGPPASGKTALLKRLAQLHNASLTSVYVDSSIDSKTLLGGYVCTEVPGEFVWKQGVLTAAVAAGGWIVFEQLQDVPMEILTLLIDLVETKVLRLPQKNTILQVPESFRLLSTAHIHSDHKQYAYICDKWVVMEIAEYTMADFMQIGVGIAPYIGQECVLQSLWTLFQRLKAIPGRPLYLRDWGKFCIRVNTLIFSLYGAGGIRNSYLTEQLQELIAYEAFELLGTGRGSACPQVFSETLGLSLAAFQRHYGENRPVYRAEASQATIGRAPSMPIATIKSSFVYTAYTLRLLERLSVALHHSESLLLVGETGCGKTSIVQHFAQLRGVKLHVHNLSQMSDPVDLIGGFKPLDVRTLLEPVLQEFLLLFPTISGSNAKFLEQIRKAYADKDMDKVITCLLTTINDLNQRISENSSAYDPAKVATLKQLSARTDLINKQHQSGAFLFHFVEGSLVQSLRRGEWLLLEEINLAGEEVLERLHEVLEGGSLTLVEKGETEEVERAQGFRLFGCMNPGRSAGKKDLALPIRLKFTEIYVTEMTNRSDISELVGAGLYGLALGATVESVVDLYIAAREAAESGMIEDGRGRPPQFSLRTLSRSLEYARMAASVYSFPVALYNGLLVYFCSQLSPASLSVLEKTLNKLKPASVRPPRAPGPDYISIEGFWLQTGPIPLLSSDKSFIQTPSVRRNLQTLARSMVMNSAILLEGPTSVGKTALIEHLALRSGHRFIRINNHQHTDVDEYIGSYVTNESGKLEFKEGILVEALRNGYFVVLDELNLAPSEVLEALNRLLDDNHELFIPETNETVKPHPHFRLFATQNPTTGYSGRKELSKAFRNRFIEMYIAALPDSEMEEILSQRCHLAPSFAKALVQIMRNLQVRRTSSHAFLGKEGMVTMRDLLRIAGKCPGSYEELGHACYVVLGERLRSEEEKTVVLDVIRSHIRNLDIDMDRYYSLYCGSIDFQKDTVQLADIMRNQPPQGLSGFTWTRSMRRLYCLLDQAMKLNEPVLLVGETGCGKTTICQVLAALRNRRLRMINCHQHSETADFLGGLRPVRGRNTILKACLQSLKDIAASNSDLERILHDSTLTPEDKLVKARALAVDFPAETQSFLRKYDKVFEWADGPLLQSMQEGSILLIDEISLADESVLERLNSVLEPSRKLLVPEKGGEWSEELTASPGFQLIATMNPGGDYGKKELSPALRNRFTEIWVQIDSRDMREVIDNKVTSAAVETIITFVDWYNQWAKVPISLRDVCFWADFVRRQEGKLGIQQALWHGACLTLLDAQTDVAVRDRCSQYLSQTLGISVFQSTWIPIDTPTSFGIEPFSLPCGTRSPVKYSFSGPTVSRNLFKLLRALQLPKPVLLEGSPGVGKTSIIESLACYTGHTCIRINLSEETDLMDLLGSDLPVGEGFEWCDGPLLSAMKAGSWVVLDELNLCPQPVIEGLNAVLDHRGTVYLPDLGLEVTCASGFRLFAAQNPLSQGGGRKGLPKSFLNRFSRINVETLSQEDYRLIADSLYSGESEYTHQIVRFNAKIGSQEDLSRLGEFNLRDVLRWRAGAKPELLYYYRMRNVETRRAVASIYREEFGADMDTPALPFFHVSQQFIYIGSLTLPLPASIPLSTELSVLPHSLSSLEQLLISIHQAWPVLLTGAASVGKSSLVRLAAALYEVPLAEYALSSGTDSCDLLGSYEQTDQGKFAWVDSSLVKAAAEGTWVLLKHANMCPPSVLDRINSLLEPNGFLMLNEKGSAQANIVKPKAGFRVILTCDPKYGEVSRALRNRCVEIAVLSEFSYYDVVRLRAGTRLIPEGVVNKEKSLNSYVKWGKMTEKQVKWEQKCKLALGLEQVEQSKAAGPELYSLWDKIRSPIDTDILEDTSISAGKGTIGLSFLLERASEIDINTRFSHLQVSSSVQSALIQLLSSLTPYLRFNSVPIAVERSPNGLQSPYLPALIHWFLLTILEKGERDVLLPCLDLEIWVEAYYSCFPVSQMTQGKALYRLRKAAGSQKVVVPEQYLALRSFISLWKARLPGTFGFLNPYEDLEITGLTTVFYESEEQETCEIRLIADQKDFSILRHMAWNRIKGLLLPSVLSNMSQSLQSGEKLPSFPVNVPYIQSLLDIYASFRASGNVAYLQRLTFECLRNSNKPKSSFKALFEEITHTSLYTLPENWAILELIQSWPLSNSPISLLPEYISSLGPDAESLSDLGLSLYESYRSAPEDPVACYEAELSDLQAFQTRLETNKTDREQIEKWKYGGVYSDFIFKTYENAARKYAERSERVGKKVIRPGLEPNSLFMQHCKRLLTSNRLKTTVSGCEKEEKRQYALQLLDSLIESTEPYLYQCADLAGPIVEGLLLARLQLRVETLSNPPLFPLSLSESLSSDNIAVLAFAAHTQSKLPASFSSLLGYHLKSLRRALQVPHQTLKLHLPTYTDLKSVHTVGQLNKEEAEAAQKEQDKEELERMFPSYEGDSWQVPEVRAKEELEDLFEMWEFAVGRRGEEAAERYLQAVGTAEEEWDWRSKAQLHTLRTRVDQYSLSVHYSFYKDPNPPELRLLYTPLSALVLRVADIRSQYPEAPVLTDILQLVKKTLDLPLFHTSLMQALTCIEHVLAKCQEWEDYASSAVSLRLLVQPLYAVIKRWRQIEISTWQDLLAHQERHYVKLDLRLWTGFVLAAEEATDAKGLYEVLEEFIRCSSMALFPHRLELLKPYFSKSHVFAYIYHYFSEFLPEFESIREELTGDASQQLFEAIKLTKFDLSNHHALKESILRQQRHLHKLLKNYSTALESSFQDCVLKRIRGKYERNVLEVGIEMKEKSGEVVEGMEELVRDVFERLEMLKENIGEAGLRRKALRDLFVGLTDLGFTSTPASHDSSAFYNQPVLAQVSPAFEETYKAAESYYFRSVDRLSLMQQSGSVSKDISSGDREKCQNYAIALVLETMKTRRSAIREVEEAEGLEWVRNVQEIADKDWFEALQRYIVGEIVEKPVKPCIRSWEEAEIYLSSRTNSSIAASFPKPNRPIDYSQVQSTLQLYRSTAKLTYVVTSLFLSLFHNGFCKPENAPDSGEEEDNKGELQEGTGMAEGTGERDCTKELEDQQQLEALRDEEQRENEEKKGGEEEDAMDMDADFEGKEGDVGSDEAEEAEEREGEAEGNEKLLEDVEETMKESKDQEVRDSAQPETTEEGAANTAQQEQAKGEVEDFEFNSEQSGSEEPGSNPESEGDESPQALDVEKRSNSGESGEEEEGEDSSNEGPMPEDLAPPEPIEDNADMMDIDSEDAPEEVEMDPRYRNRRFTDYNNSAYGVKDKPANTPNVANAEDLGGEEAEQVQGSDIVSRLRKEWSKGEAGERTAEETRDKQVKGEEEVKADILVEDKEAESRPDPTSSDAFKYDQTADSKAAAPSTTQDIDFTPSELTHRKEQLPQSDLTHTPASEPPQTHPVTKPEAQEQPATQSLLDPVLPPTGPHFSDSFSTPLTSIKRAVEEEANTALPILEEAMDIEEPSEPDLSRGKSLWEQYQRTTQSAAQELCEQLRIVLEPTKANSLQGDYKTGKRINMKKVISYIASRFRKDKIWLRRTKNSTREYQVLLAIDDSFSMAEHGLGTSALKGLCVLIQALRSLEVGELAVARIREGMGLLHDFKAPFTQEKAEEVVSQFRFDYGRKQGADTAYPLFLQQCIEYLHQSGKSDLQLVLIISDGRINKRQVRPYLLKAQQILFLCIILDNPAASILAMKSTTFLDTPTGPQVEFKPYLEDFPFAHYIVLENPNLLVHSLCDVIRQWFEFVKDLS